MEVSTLNVGRSATASGVAASRRRGARKKFLRRKSTTAFLMALPLILIVGALVLYPAFYSIHLATLNKSMERFVGPGGHCPPHRHSPRAECLSFLLF